MFTRQGATPRTPQAAPQRSTLSLTWRALCGAALLTLLIIGSLAARGAAAAVSADAPGYAALAQAARLLPSQRPAAAPTDPGFGSTPAPGSTLNLGRTGIGTPISATITISETGGAALVIANPVLSEPNGDHDYTLTGPAFPLTIADGGAAQQLTVTCRPTLTRTRFAVLRLDTNDPTQPNVYYLFTCTGTNPAYSSAPGVGSVIDFGSTSVGTAITTTLTIYETGNDTLRVSSPTFSGADQR